MERLVTLTLVTGTLDKAREDDGRNWIGKGEARHLSFVKGAAGEFQGSWPPKLKQKAPICFPNKQQSNTAR